MRHIILLVVIVTLLAQHKAFAQDERIPIIVSATSNDIIGERLVYKIKEELRKSAGLRLADVNAKTGIYLNLVTIDSSIRNPGASTTYSAVWTLDSPDLIFPYYLHSYVGYCGNLRVDQTAQDLVAITDRVVTDTQRLIHSIQLNDTSTQSDNNR